MSTWFEDLDRYRNEYAGLLAAAGWALQPSAPAKSQDEPETALQAPQPGAPADGPAL